MTKPDIWLDEMGIIHENHHVAMVTFDVANYAIQERARLAGNEQMPVLVRFSRIFGFTEDTRHIDLNVMLRNIKALAFCVQGEEEVSISQKLLIEGFFEKTPYPVPVNVFYDEAAAIKWLIQQK